MNVFFDDCCYFLGPNVGPNMLSKPSWGNRKKGRSFQLPSHDIEGWLKKINALASHSAGGQPSVDSGRTGHPVKRGSTPDLPLTQEKKKRSDMPVVRKVDKGAMATVDNTLTSAAARNDALKSLVDDFYASSSQVPRNSQLKTWERYHNIWYGDQVPVWPLTEQSVIRVSALFKLGGYKSFSL